MYKSLNKHYCKTTFGSKHLFFRFQPRVPVGSDVQWPQDRPHNLSQVPAIGQQCCQLQGRAVLGPWDTPDRSRLRRRVIPCYRIPELMLPLGHIFPFFICPSSMGGGRKKFAGKKSDLHILKKTFSLSYH